MEGRRVLIVGFAGALALGALTSPALASKSGKSKKPGPVQTATATVTTSSPLQVATATATCPKKTKVVGGGWSSTTSGTPLSDLITVTESRRAGNKAWAITGVRADTGPAGPALPLTAEAYCRKNAGKISESAATQQATGAGLQSYLPGAACPRNKAVLGGGFTFAPTANSVPVFVGESTPIGGVGWSLAAVGTSAAMAPFATVYAYCQKRDKPLPQRTGSGTLAGVTGSVATADSAPCGGKRSAIGGGFAGAQLFAGTSIPGFVESRRAGKSWHIAATNLGGANPSSITAIAICD